jgi:hypothetical protein
VIKTSYNRSSDNDISSQPMRGKCKFKGAKRMPVCSILNLHYKSIKAETNINLNQIALIQKQAQRKSLLHLNNFNLLSELMLYLLIKMNDHRTNLTYANYE